MERVERGEGRRGGKGGCEKCAIVSLSFSLLLLKDESFIAHFISRSSTALPSRRRLSPSLSSRYSSRLNLHLKREGERERRSVPGRSWRGSV